MADKVRIAVWNGAPTLMINGQPDTGLMLYHNHPEKGVEEIADFARAGIDLLTCGLGSVQVLREDGSFDFSSVDQRMAVILKANPNARVLTRVGLNPPAWWYERNPGQKSVHFDPYLDQNVDPEWPSVSPSSQAWRRDFAPVLAALIRACEARYGDHFLAYQLCSGDCGEWSYAWRHYTQSDYSAAQAEGFRAWLKARYRTPTALRKAWGAGVTFKTAAIRRDWRKGADDSFLLDPVGDRDQRDYLEYASWVTADAILHFAAAAKAALREAGSEKPVGVFYGYHFPPPGQSSAFINSGHHALERVLRCEDVDFICAPYSYHQREDGGTFFSQIPTASVRLHGKLFYSEEDTVTYLVPPHPYRYHADTREKTEHVLLRDTLGALRDGGTSWYMDWFGQNWYRDPELMASIAETQTLARRRLDWDKTSVAQTAVVVSERTAFSLRHHNGLLDAWSILQLAELHRLGAPLDVYLTSDLPLLVAAGRAEPYKLIVFLDVPEFTGEERLAVAALRSNGRTLIWTYAPDVMQGGADGGCGAIAALTQLRVKRLPPGGLMVETGAAGVPLSYGIHAVVDPRFAGDDPAGRVLGRLAGTQEAGILERTFESHRVVWSAAPCLPVVLLRRFARAAGVHLYSEAGDQVLAEKRLLTLHAASDGPRRIALPCPGRVTDAFTGVIVSERTDHIAHVVAKGRTYVWILG